LVSYVVPTECDDDGKPVLSKDVDTEMFAQHCREFLKKKLPQYMVWRRVPPFLKLSHSKHVVGAYQDSGTAEHAPHSKRQNQQAGFARPVRCAYHCCGSFTSKDPQLLSTRLGNEKNIKQSRIKLTKSQHTFTGQCLVQALRSQHGEY